MEFNLLDLPVAPEHAAHAKCKNFAEYFNKTWLTGQFKDLLWNFMESESRTSNVAEIYHSLVAFLLSNVNSVLKRRLNCRRPLSTLIENLRAFQKTRYLDLIKVRTSSVIKSSAFRMTADWMRISLLWCHSWQDVSFRLFCYNRLQFY